MSSIQGLERGWREAGWLEQADAWARGELERREIALAGPAEQCRISPWSSVLALPTSAGTIYFKACAPALAHEPALTWALSRWRPDCVPRVLATSLERGWMLLEDGGPTLRSQLGPGAGLGRWGELLPRYAELQLDMLPQANTLLGLGVFDRRLALLPRLYSRLLDDEDALLLGRPGGLSSSQHRRLRRLAPRFAELCAQLASYDIPETLHHDDFHDGNILLRAGEYIFFDWGESCLTHPFFTLTVTLRSISYRFALAGDAPELAELRDRYLAPWARYEPYDRLLAAFRLASRVGMVNRALTWQQVLADLDAPTRQEHGEAVPGWLQEFLGVEG